MKKVAGILLGLLMVAILVACIAAIASAQVPVRQLFWLEMLTPAEKVGQTCIIDSRIHVWTLTEQGLITVTKASTFDPKHCDEGTTGTKGEELPGYHYSGAFMS